MNIKNKLLVATSNVGKFEEINECLHGIDLEIVSLNDLGITSDHEETGETFAKNATHKARFYADKSGFLTLAEDSGILVDALPGQLGVKTRRFGAGENATDEQWLEYFFEVMKDVPLQNRGACFVCTAVLVFPNGKYEIFEGKTNGVITFGLEAPIYRGLPLSSCFRPEGFDKVYSALGIEEKNRVSHRGKAIKKLREFLEDNN